MQEIRGNPRKSATRLNSNEHLLLSTLIFEILLKYSHSELYVLFLATWTALSVISCISFVDSSSNLFFSHPFFCQRNLASQEKFGICRVNSEAREWRHDSDKTQTNQLESWMILKISLRAKAVVPKTVVKQTFCLHSLYFHQNTLMLTESRESYERIHFRLCVLRYFHIRSNTQVW